jgi:V-type H+-transporting ATPase subunit H
LVDVAKGALKEKLIRVVVATWKNLIEKAIKPNLAAFLVSKVLNVCETLAGRKYTDSDILEDITFIKTELSISFQNLR